jgi:hypothetical protein
MKFTYKLGKTTNWNESAIIGIVALVVCIVGAMLSTLFPILLGLMGVVLFIAGITGFLKRVEK